MFSLQQQANAQIFAPTFPQQFLATATPISSIVDDITVNCDMLSNADGQPIRAIVWDDGSEGTSGLGIGQGHLYVADYAGTLSRLISREHILMWCWAMTQLTPE